MATTNGTMKSLRVTDPQGNVYILTPVDTTARTAAASAASLAQAADRTSVKYGNLAGGADEYSPTASYDVGDYCYRENVLYRCTSAIVSPGEAWTPAHWSEVTMTGLISVAQSAAETAQTAASAASTLATNLNKDSVKYRNIVDNPPEYNASAAYAVGDYCYRENELYKCKTAIVSPGESWNSAHWDKIIVNDLIEEAQTTADSAVDAIEAAKNLQFDDVYFTIEEEDEDVKVGLNGAPIGVDTGTPLVIESDTAEGFVLGADTLFTSSLAGSIPEFSSSATYAVGDRVRHLSRIYECTTAVQTAGGWVASSWTELSLAGMISKAGQVEIANVAGTVSGTTRTATLLADKYCKVTVGDTDTALVLSLADRSSTPTVLQQVGFEFTLGSSSVLASMEVHSGGYSLPVKGDTTFTAGKIYQGTVVDGLVTICEFDQPTALN